MIEILNDLTGAEKQIHQIAGEIADLKIRLIEASLEALKAEHSIQTAKLQFISCTCHRHEEGWQRPCDEHWTAFKELPGGIYPVNSSLYSREEIWTLSDNTDLSLNSLEIQPGFGNSEAEAIQDFLSKNVN